MSDFDDDDNKADSQQRKAKLVPVELHSRHEQEAAVCALRMIETEGWHARLLERRSIRDHDILRLIGMEDCSRRDDHISVAELRELLPAQLARLERRWRSTNDCLARNIAKLGAILKLNPAEHRILRLAAIATRDSKFGDLFRCVLATQVDLARGIAAATGLKSREVNAAFASNRPLRRSGFFENLGAHNFKSRGSNPLELEEGLMGALFMPRLDEQSFLRRLVRVAPAATLTLDDYQHLAELPLLRSYLGDAVSARRKGVNILLYGAPGTGKTEFVRSLAVALKLDLYEVPNQDGDGDPISGQRRFSAYAVCQNLLAVRRGQLLLFDEVEDVFGRGESPLGHMYGRGHVGDADELRKSWVNETLEGNPVPAVWVCNSIRAIDQAYLRRFDLALEFAVPTRSVRRRIIDRYFWSGEISSACMERLSGFEDLSPALVARAAKVARSLRVKGAANRDAEVERIVGAALKAGGFEHKPDHAVQATQHYDTAFLNADRDLGLLESGLRKACGARLCLYGPPGSGKTAFGHHLGRVLDRRVIVKRGSDLLGMYVGEAEKNIARAFGEAREENAILVIDEADGFLRDRAGAQRNWEVTQVNELLTQMEAFEGIFIASTNLIDTLDPASLRRFDFKVKFDWLTREQCRAMLRRVAGDFNEFARLAIDRLDHLTPGDFANVLRQLRVTNEPITPASVVKLLAQEVAMKPEGQQRSIGFLAT